MWAEFWDAAMDVGRPETPADKIAKYTAQLAAARKSFGGGASDDPGAGYQGNQAEITSLEKKIALARKEQRMQEQGARRQADLNEEQRKGKTADNAINGLITQAGGIDVVNKKLTEFHQQLKDLKAAAIHDPLIKLPTDAQISKVEEYIRRTNGKGDNVSPAAAFSPDKARAQSEVALLRDQLKTEEEITKQAYANNELTVERYYEKRRELLLRENKLEMQVRQEEMRDAKRAMGLALNANQRVEASGRVVKLEGEIALLKQQQTTAVNKLNAEEVRVNTQLERRIALIKQAQAERSQTNALATEGAIAQQMAKVGLTSQATLLEKQKDLEQRRYEIVRDGLQKRLAVEGQSPEAIAQINAQIEDLEQQHADKMGVIALEIAENKMKPMIDVWAVAKNSADGFFNSLADRTTTFQQKFMKLVDSIISGITRIAAQMISDNLFGGGANGGSNGGALGGLLGQLLNMSGLTGQMSDMAGMSLNGTYGSGVQSGLDALIANVASFDVGTNYVPKTGLALIHQGEAIVPAAANKVGNYNPGGDVTIHNNFALPAAVDNRTMAQIAASAGGSISLAMRRNK
jgi:hypothetical protein